MIRRVAMSAKRTSKSLPADSVWQGEPPQEEEEAEAGEEYEQGEDVPRNLPHARSLSPLACERPASPKSPKAPLRDALIHSDTEAAPPKPGLRRNKTVEVKPQTPNPRPSTLNPRPSILKPEPYTLNLKL